MKIKYICIDCDKENEYVDDNFGPKMYQGVYNTGIGNKQMCISCANKRGFKPFQHKE